MRKSRLANNRYLDSVLSSIPLYSAYVRILAVISLSAADIGDTVVAVVGGVGTLDVACGITFVTQSCVVTTETPCPPLGLI